MELKDKVVVVTGGAEGIGAGLARRFAREGAKSVIVADRNGEGAAAVAKEIGGDSVDLTAMFGLHAQMLYDAAVRLQREDAQ